MKRSNAKPLTLCVIAFSAVLNLLGGTLALALRLPVYLDSFGTMLTAVLLGPAAGMIPGIISGIVSGCTSDVYAFFYLPVQMILGLVCGLCARYVRSLNRRTCLGLLPLAAVITLPGTLASSLITALVFGGITSSGSTVLVQLLHTAGLPLTGSVFLVQFLTDYLDRILMLAAVAAVLPVCRHAFPSLAGQTTLTAQESEERKKNHGTI